MYTLPKLIENNAEIIAHLLTIIFITEDNV